MGVKLPKKRLNEFLRRMMKERAFVAPVRREEDDVAVFEELAGPADLQRLEFGEVPQFTAKKFFMPAYETLFTYDTKQQKLVEKHVAAKPRVLFGLRLCDLNAVKIQDKLFLEDEYVDDHYKAARDNIYLVGWYCNEPPDPEHCFCESMGLTNYYDLMLREKHDAIYVDVGSPRGAELLASLRMRLEEHHEEIPQINTEKHLKTHDIRDFWEHPLWERVANEECLSCQRCTQMCPTCMCFDIYDANEQDLHTGERERTWDSCHNKEFTRVAGDHYFRPERAARFKHRVYHKVVYYPEVFGTSMCTGCGRCIKYCPPHIDFVEMINSIHEKKEYQSEVKVNF